MSGEPAKPLPKLDEETDTVVAYPELKEKPDKLRFETFIERYLRDFGPFQWITLLVMASPCLAPAIHIMSTVFIMGDHEPITFYCKGTNPNFSMVCERTYLRTVIQGSYYLGQMIGSLIISIISDRNGRRLAFIISVIIQIYCATWVMIPLGVSAYVLGRIGLGFAHYGLFGLPLVMALEMLSPDKRKWATFGAGCLFSTGQVILGFIAMLELDMLEFQFAIFLPMVLLLFCVWFSYESPRWLLSQGRTKEAGHIFARVAHWNKTCLPSNWQDMIEIEHSGPQPTVPLTALFKTPKICLRFIVVICLWPVVSMVYYGMSTKMDLLGGNLYANFIAGGLVEIPANLLVMMFIDKIGRRWMTFIALMVVSFSLASSLVFTQDNTAAWISLVQILVAKCAATAVYSTIYTYTPELFPTSVRTRAVGVCSLFARVGGILSSFMVYYLVPRFGRVVIVIPFAVLAFIAAIGVRLLLPETAGTHLPQTVEDVEHPSTRKERAKEHELQPLTSDAKNV
uniref:MFS domain-containing protein n=1 Tax=Panagrellus redivivus TaxID=6233 RepID=A0A7E4V393_PANRE